MAKPKKTEAKHPTTKARKIPSHASLGEANGSASHTAGDGTLTVDRRSGDRRKVEDRRKTDVPVPVERRKLERRVKVTRRRQIDPTTCERDYTDDEIEFMNALEEYKRSSGRMFPTCSEILEVLRKLGYEKVPQTNGQTPQVEISIVDIFRPRPANQL